MVDAVEVDVFVVMVLGQQLEGFLIAEDISAHRRKTRLLEGRNNWSRRSRSNRWWMYFLSSTVWCSRTTQAAALGTEVVVV